MHRSLNFQLYKSHTNKYNLQQTMLAYNRQVVETTQKREKQN